MDHDPKRSTLGDLREGLAVTRDILIVIVLGWVVYAWARASIETSEPAIEVHEAVPEERSQPSPR